MTKTLLSVCGLSLLLMSVAAGRAAAQTTAVAPYYATPSWDQQLPCSSSANCPRFIVLSNWNNAAILDRETGLVWMRAPVDDPALSFFGHDIAPHFCVVQKSGNRGGWRLPTIQELSRLLDYSIDADGDLPAGHPFVDVENHSFWAATTVVGADDRFYRVSFPGGIHEDLRVNGQQLLCVQSSSPGAEAQ
jgi:hypothetical protein